MSVEGNTNAMRHGARSELTLKRRAMNKKRTSLRQLGLRQEQLDGIGRALLADWSRSAAIVELYFEFGSERGWLNDDGNPPGFSATSVCYFALSSRSVANFSARDTLAAGIGEITGTGYERQVQDNPGWSAPWLSKDVVADFEPVVWATRTARDWPEAVRSVVLATSPDDSGVAICAWNLREGGKSRDMSESFMTDTFSPTLKVSPPQ